MRPGESAVREERSLEPITDEDLRRLGAIAARDRNDLFARRPVLGRRYSARLFAVALCQGAAMHRIDGKTGVKDLDVWSFYLEHPEGPYPCRRNGTADFGHPRFGKTPGSEHFIGRRVDLLGRSLPIASGSDPVRTLRSYLRRQATESARQLARKAVVLIEPESLLGTIVWPVS